MPERLKPKTGDWLVVLDETHEEAMEVIEVVEIYDLMVSGFSLFPCEGRPTAANIYDCLPFRKPGRD